MSSIKDSDKTDLIIKRSYIKKRRNSILVSHFHDVYAELSCKGVLRLYDHDFSLRARKTIQLISAKQMHQTLNLREFKQKISIPSQYEEHLLLPLFDISKKIHWFLCYNSDEKTEWQKAIEKMEIG